MTKVLDLNKRLEVKKYEKQIKEQREKIEVVQKFMQCSSCYLKCAMCGQHFKDTESAKSTTDEKVDHCLCKTCGMEFDDFVKISKGEKEATNLWHNKEWLKLWSTWVDHQEAISEFKQSAEYKKLIEKYYT